MNETARRIYDILRSEFSDITSQAVLEMGCRAIVKNPGGETEITPDTVTPAHIEDIIPSVTTGALLFGGEAKAKTVIEKLRTLK